MAKLNQEFHKLDKEKFRKWLPGSTYEDSNSDEDEYHISKPFEK